MNNIIWNFGKNYKIKHCIAISTLGLQSQSICLLIIERKKNLVYTWKNLQKYTSIMKNSNFLAYFAFDMVFDIKFFVFFWQNHKNSKCLQKNLKLLWFVEYMWFSLWKNKTNFPFKFHDKIEHAKQSIWPLKLFHV